MGQTESKLTGQELSNSMCISVDNVAWALEKAKDAGMVVKGDVKKVVLPYYGGNGLLGSGHESESTLLRFECVPLSVC